MRSPCTTGRTGCAMNWAWLPWRCGATTARARGAVGHLGATQATHQVQAAVEAGSGAGRRQHAAVVDVQHVGIEPHLGWRSANAGAGCQWVVAGRPSSSPASASTNAPRYRPSTVAPRWWAARSVSSSSGGAGRRSSCHDGTTTMSAAPTGPNPSGHVDAEARTGVPS